MEAHAYGTKPQMRRPGVREHGTSRRTGCQAPLLDFPRFFVRCAHDSRSRHWQRDANPNVSERRAMGSPNFPSGDFPFGLQPWAIIQQQRIEDDRIRPRPKARLRRGGLDRRPLRLDEGKEEFCLLFPWLGVGSMVPSRFQPNARMACTSRWLVRRRHCPYRHFGNAPSRLSNGGEANNSI